GGAPAVAVELEHVLEQALDVVQGVRPLVVARELDDVPELVALGLLFDALELPLEPHYLGVELRSAQQPGRPQLRQPLAQLELGFTRHCRTTSGAWRRCRAAARGGRPHRRGRSGSWTRRA